MSRPQNFADVYRDLVNLPNDRLRFFLAQRPVYAGHSSDEVRSSSTVWTAGANAPG